MILMIIGLGAAVEGTRGGAGWAGVGQDSLSGLSGRRSLLAVVVVDGGIKRHACCLRCSR